jgi:hypothetical protein
MQANEADTAKSPSRISELQSSENQWKLREWLKPADPSSNHWAACKKTQPPRVLTDAPTFPCLNGPGRLLNLRKLPYSSPIAQRAG